MTADLYVRDGSRFVPLPDVLKRDVPPIPVPRRLDGWDPAAVPTAAEPVVRVGVSAYRVYAPQCPHGRFSRPGGPGRGCRRCRP